MSDLYHQLLEAAIERLEGMKARGTRFVVVSPETLSGLAQGGRVAPARNPLAPPPAGARAPARVAAPQPPPTPRSAEAGAASEQPLALGLEEAPAPALAGPALSPEAKAAAWAELRAQVMPCVKCPHLAAARRNVVFGVGDINAQLMFVGEAPGLDEDEQGEPFVGKAGQLLTRIIQAMGLARNSVYIANILKCRPDTPGQSAGNRKPTSEEMRTCIPYLHRQIDLIGPKVIVGLGATALEGLQGKSAVGITRLRGQWQTFRGIPLMPTYHPAYLLRNQLMSEKRKVWEDMLQVMARLGLPITQKQRNFFLKP